MFGKLYIKFHQNRPSFIADIVKNILWYFFPDTVYIAFFRKQLFLSFFSLCVN